MSGYHIVRAGDCINSIAEKSGHFWESIWNAGENEDLRAIRADPNSLHVGDRVFVPDRESKTISLDTSKRHRLVRVGVPSKLVLRLLWPDGRPRADVSYTLRIDGKPPIEGVTDPDGYLEVTISGFAKQGMLTMHAEDEEEEDESFPLALGQLPPHDLLIGGQARLRNLGFTEVKPSGTLDDASRTALSRFQSGEGLQVTGEFDSETALALLRAHGS
jgi:hypothetical protein